jgi:aspartate-semialdehyde dehydrogenase
VTPDQINQAYALLQTLNQLRAQQASFQKAKTFTIQAASGAGALGQATFPAASYGVLVEQAFGAQITSVSTALTELGVTGF